MITVDFGMILATVLITINTIAFLSTIPFFLIMVRESEKKGKYLNLFCLLWISSSLLTLASTVVMFGFEGDINTYGKLMELLQLVTVGLLLLWIKHLKDTVTKYLRILSNKFWKADLGGGGRYGR